MDLKLTTDDVLVLIERQVTKLQDMPNLYIPAGKDGVRHLVKLANVLWKEVVEQ